MLLPCLGSGIGTGGPPCIRGLGTGRLPRETQKAEDPGMGWRQLEGTRQPLLAWAFLRKCLWRGHPSEDVPSLKVSAAVY